MNNSDLNNEDMELLYLLHGDEALSVLNALVKRDPILAAVVMQEVRDVLHRPSVIEEVAESVYRVLHTLTIEECFSITREQRYGTYYEVGEVAYMMFREALKEFTYTLKTYHEAKQPKLATEYFKGILMGLYRYEQHPLDGQFFDTLDETLPNYVQDRLDEWNDIHPKDDEYTVSLKTFAKEHCEDWSFIQEELTQY
jgi:hypothetical protein